MSIQTSSLGSFGSSVDFSASSHVAPSCTVRITSSFKGYWYEKKEGHLFSARFVPSVPVCGHVHSLGLWEIVGGDHDGDYVLQGHVEVVA